MNKTSVDSEHYDTPTCVAVCVDTSSATKLLFSNKASGSFYIGRSLVSTTFLWFWFWFGQNTDVSAVPDTEGIERVISEDSVNVR
eukprot:SAG31_NODE_11602_length_1014_cov_1.209836_2_plen_85_part_00